MTDTSPQPDATDEVALAVRNLMPDLRQSARTTLMLFAGALIVGGIALAIFFASDMTEKAQLQLSMFAFLGVFAVMVFSYTSMIKRQQSLIMPVLARAIGLSYAKSADAFIGFLPSRLLPARGIRKSEDYIRGTLGAHEIQMAELKVETGGKNSRTLFKGIVVQFPNRVVMPSFFVALDDKIRAGSFFGGDLKTDGLHHLRNVDGYSGKTYSIWTSWTGQDEPPALAAVVKVLTHIENHIGPEVELYAATSNGEEMHLALSHKRNLFSVGGFFPTEDKVFADVRSAMQDLMMPLTLAKALISAEELAMTGKS